MRDYGLSGPSVRADVHFQGRRGEPLDVAVTLIMPSGEPLLPKHVSVSFAPAAHELEPVQREAQYEGGRWNVHGLMLPAIPSWRITIAVLVSDFEEVETSGEEQLPP